MKNVIYAVLFLFCYSRTIDAAEYRRVHALSSTIYEESAQNPEKFWAECSKEIEWFTPWEKLKEGKMPFVQWYLGGKLNISYNCLDRHLAEIGDKTALIWRNERGSRRELTYKGLFTLTCKLANALKEAGVKKGDVVGIYMPMIPEGVASMLACARIGAVHSVIFGGTGAGSLREKLVDARAKCVITADGTFRKGKIVCYKPTLDEALSKCPDVKKVLVFQHTGQKISMQEGRDIWADKLLASQNLECLPEWMDAEDPLFILYTSGTTGKPKGICHTTGGYLVGVHNTYKWIFDAGYKDIYWSTADIGWITGHSYVVYGPLSNGVTQVIYEGGFDYPATDQAWKIIEEESVSIFYTAPTLIRTLMKWDSYDENSHNLSSLKLLGSIGEPLNPEAWQWYFSKIGREQCPIVDTWFQTETGAFVIAPMPGITPVKPGSVTRALPGCSAAIFNKEGEQVDKGLLALTTPIPSMMRGVLNDPQRYIDTYWKMWDCKYYYAGDAAEIDQDGDLWVRGRADEVILVSGHRIGTAETENVLVSHPKIVEAAVIGVPDEITGQAIVVFAIPSAGVEPDQELEIEVAKYVAAFQGAYARPKAVKFVPLLPKTRSGKILRRLILKSILGESCGDISTLENPQAIEAIEASAHEVGKRLHLQ